ncbi:hypothetical protein BJV82DRAFT_666998 [Fennellomyces sp. T-0311]|nr:hypothetical protein BJV82DRAFT_666998 [Fennellomyces sp. T-0311]
MVMDVLGIFALTSPAVVGVLLSLGAGTATTNSSVATAIILIRASYMMWFVWVASLGGAMCYAAVRLVRILKAHHRKHRHPSNDVAVMSGIRKVQFLAATSVICLGGFGILLFSYSVLRDQILANKVASVFAGFARAFMCGLATLFAEIACGTDFYYLALD